MSKSVWLIAIMGLLTALALSLAMTLSLGQFKEVPAADWVKLAAQTTNEFKFTEVAVRVNLGVVPSLLKISYHTPADTKFDLAVQNAEMEKVAGFAIKNYKGRDLGMIDQIQITRSETHGSGCFKQTYVSSMSVPNPRRPVLPGGGQPFTLPGRDR